MKNILSALCIALIPMISACGQSSQKRVLLQQIAALKVYGDYVHKGYSIAKKGLRTISDVKNGELNLHSLFYTALKTVNPGIRNYEKVAAIIALQVKIFGQYDAMSGLLYDELFYGDEQDYIERVFARLLEDCDANLGALTDLVTDTSLEMSDADRLQRIDALYGQMLDNYTFSRHFADQAIALKKAREREHKDINSSKSLYHLNQQP